MTDEVCRRVRRKSHVNTEYMKIRRVCGVNDETIESDKAE